jgi:hypothetical protein
MVNILLYNKNYKNFLNHFNINIYCNNIGITHLYSNTIKSINNTKSIDLLLFILLMVYHKKSRLILSPQIDQFPIGG